MVGMGEYQEIIYQLTVGSDRQVRFFNAQSGAPIALDLRAALAKVPITATARAAGTGNRCAFGTDDGRLIPGTPHRSNSHPWFSDLSGNLAYPSVGPKTNVCRMRYRRSS